MSMPMKKRHATKKPPARRSASKPPLAGTSPTRVQVDEAEVERLATQPYHRHFWPDGKLSWVGSIPELGVNVKHRNSHRLCVKLLEERLRDRIRTLLAAGHAVREPIKHADALSTPRVYSAEKVNELRKTLQKARGTILILKGLTIEQFPDDSWLAQRIAETLIEIQGIGRAQMNMMFAFDEEERQWRQLSRWTYSDDDRAASPPVKRQPVDAAEFALAT